MEGGSVLELAPRRSATGRNILILTSFVVSV